MNFQVTVLKILVSYPDGFAAMADLKRDMAILATSGPEWAERTRRMGSCAPGLDIFSDALVDRLNGGWRITAKGREVLAAMEARAREPAPAAVEPAAPPAVLVQRPPAERDLRRRERRLRIRAAREKARAAAS